MSTSTIAETTDWPDTLLRMLEQQWSMVDRLESLAKKQGQLIRDRQTDALLRLLSERQQIIDQFLAMQNRMASLTDGLESRLDDVNEPQREQIRAFISNIGEALDAVMKHDEADRSQLQVSRDETKGELSGLGTANRARQAYLGTARANARFADRQG